MLRVWFVGRVLVGERRRGQMGRIRRLRCRWRQCLRFVRVGLRRDFEVRGGVLGGFVCVVFAHCVPVASLVQFPPALKGVFVVWIIHVLALCACLSCLV